MELIDLNELEKIPIRENNYDRENGSADFVSGIETVIEYARQLPKVDAVPVVRCGKCEYYHMGDENLGDCKKFKKSFVHCVRVTDFCSYGEPRTPPAE